MRSNTWLCAPSNKAATSRIHQRYITASNSGPTTAANAEDVPKIANDTITSFDRERQGNPLDVGDVMGVGPMPPASRTASRLTPAGADVNGGETSTCLTRANAD